MLSWYSGPIPHADAFMCVELVATKRAQQQLAAAAVHHSVARSPCWQP